MRTAICSTVLAGVRLALPQQVTAVRGSIGSTLGTAVRWASSRRGGSSSRYLQRQRNDVFVKQRASPSSGSKGSSSSQQYLDDDDLGNTGGFVARSAFKLLQLDDRYKFLRSGRVIVDLGAAPGGWSQAIVERTRKGRKRREGEGGVDVFALDLLPVVDIQGVRSIQGDFLDASVQDRLRKMVEAEVRGGKTVEDGPNYDPHKGGFVDVVVSDMMANTTGNPITDTEASLELCRAAASFAFSTLKVDSSAAQSEARRKSPLSSASTSSVLVMKYFMSHEADLFRKEVLEKHFGFVKAEKMAASRKESREQFWVCIGYQGQQTSQQ